MNATLRALANPTYRAFWLTNLISNVGASVQEVAQGWIVLQMTGSAAWLGVVAACARVPMLVLLPFGGVLADRFNRRRLLGMVQLFRMLPAIGLAILVPLGWAQPWHFAVAAIWLGIGSAINAPTVSVMLHDLSRPGELDSAVALQAVQFQLSRACGPLVASLVFAAAGVAYGFHANALSYLPLLLFCVVGWRAAAAPAVPKSAPVSVLASLSNGVSHARRDPVVRLILVSCAGCGMLLMSYPALFPLIAKQLGTGADGNAYLSGATGVGAFAGALIMPHALRGRDWVSVLSGAALVGGVGLLALAWAPNLPAACALAALISLAATIFGTGTATTLQRHVSDEYRGRVLALNFVAMNGGMVVGSLLTGFLASQPAGATLALACFGVGGLLAPPILWSQRRR